MKVWKKCGALFLTVLLCITMMAVPALAASDSQDGFEVTLTTDKEEYSKGEEIAATLTVYDETGRVVFTQKGDFAKGYNSISLDRALLNTTGVLYYTLETATDAATKKMIQAR